MSFTHTLFSVVSPPSTWFARRQAKWKPAPFLQCFLGHQNSYLTRPFEDVVWGHVKGNQVLTVFSQCTCSRIIALSSAVSLASCRSRSQSQIPLFIFQTQHLEPAKYKIIFKKGKKSTINTVGKDQLLPSQKAENKHPRQSVNKSKHPRSYVLQAVICGHLEPQFRSLQTPPLRFSSVFAACSVHCLWFHKHKQRWLWKH